MNDADQWSDVSGGLLPPGGNVWAVTTGGIASRGELLAVYFAAFDLLPQYGLF